MAEQVMFYPGAGHDHGPLVYFAKQHGYEQFVFADYGLNRAQVSEFMSQIPGWFIVPGSQRDLAPPDFDVADWALFWHHRCSVGDRHASFGVECELLSDAGLRVRLRYLGVDAFGCYEALLNTAGWQPNAITLQDHGFGGNWSRFGGSSRMFEAAQAAARLPELLWIADNTEPWPGYERCQDPVEMPGQMHRHVRSMYRRVG